MSGVLDGMTGLRIILDGDGSLSDVQLNESGTLTRITLLGGGMASGAPSVGLLIECDNGKKVFGQTSLKLLLSAARAFEAKYPGILD